MPGVSASCITLSDDLDEDLSMQRPATSLPKLVTQYLSGGGNSIESNPDSEMLSLHNPHSDIPMYLLEDYREMRLNSPSTLHHSQSEAAGFQGIEQCEYNHRPSHELKKPKNRQSKSCNDLSQGFESAQKFQQPIPSPVSDLSLSAAKSSSSMSY